jgi:hypothetical protein
MRNRSLAIVAASTLLTLTAVGTASVQVVASSSRGTGGEGTGTGPGFRAPQSLEEAPEELSRAMTGTGAGGQYTIADIQGALIGGGDGKVLAGNGFDRSSRQTGIVPFCAASQSAPMCRSNFGGLGIAGLGGGGLGFGGGGFGGGGIHTEVHHL